MFLGRTEELNIINNVFQINQFRNLKIGFVCISPYEEQNEKFDCIDIQKVYE